MDPDGKRHHPNGQQPAERLREHTGRRTSGLWPVPEATSSQRVQLGCCSDPEWRGYRQPHPVLLPGPFAEQSRLFRDWNFKANPIYRWGVGLRPWGWDCFLALPAAKLTNGRPRLPGGCEKPVTVSSEAPNTHKSKLHGALNPLPLRPDWFFCVPFETVAVTAIRWERLQRWGLRCRLRRLKDQDLEMFLPQT